LSNHRPVIEFFHGIGISPKTLDRNAGHLRKAKLAPPSRRGYGALPYDTAAAVNLMTGTLLAPSNSKVVETVQTLRSRHMTSARFNPLSPEAPFEGHVRAAFASVAALGIHLVGPLNVSAMLCAVVDSIRSGAFDKWAGEDGQVTVDFHDGGRGTLIYFDRHVVNEAAVLAFVADKSAPRPPVERMIRINEQVLRGLAAALGPPAPAIPPPPS